MRRINEAARLVCVLLCAAAGLAGCSHPATGVNTLEEQKASVMGGPAPASAKTQIDALRAAQAERQAAGMQKAQASATQRKP